MTYATVDTTARAFVKSALKIKALNKAVSAVLEKERFKLAKMSVSKLKPAVEVYEISFKGPT